jgi:hypothetical protein
MQYNTPALQDNMPAMSYCIARLQYDNAEKRCCMAALQDCKPGLQYDMRALQCDKRALSYCMPRLRYDNAGMQYNRGALQYDKRADMHANPADLHSSWLLINVRLRVSGRQGGRVTFLCLPFLDYRNPALCPSGRLRCSRRSCGAVDKQRKVTRPLQRSEALDLASSNDPHFETAASQSLQEPQTNTSSELTHTRSRRPRSSNSPMACQPTSARWSSLALIGEPNFSILHSGKGR